MPHRDYQGKSSENYRESLITALDSISPRSRRLPRPNPLLFVWLLIPVAALWLNWSKVLQHFEHTAPIKSAEIVAPPSWVRTDPQGPLPSTQAAREDVRSSPKALSECLNGGTDINEAVLRCRYGEIPRPGPDVKPAHGMVSASYLAKYQTDQAVQSAGPAPSHRAGVESHMISGWDGTSSYLATWQVINDDIDSSSVCLNYKRGSIDYRECRKGAKQWFKDQCRQAGRGAGEGGEGGEITKRRYCSAASAFSPMG